MTTSNRQRSRGRGFRCTGYRVMLVALTIGCLLTAPVLAQRHPHHSFMPNGSWQFENFGTERLSGATFQQAFDLNFFDYLNPITGIMYLAGRGMAEGGNCFGMGLLASAGEHSAASGLSTPFSGRLQEDFWSNYPTRTSNLTRDINTYQWRQLSTHFVTRWLVGLAESPERVADRIASDIDEEKYGVLCINSGGAGHALVPISVTRTSENIDIVVYDCNLPLGDVRPNTLVINRSSGTWRYHRDWSESAGWHDTWTGGSSGISYVSFSNSPGWRNLLNDPIDLILIMGQDTEVAQITDQQGRKLYRRAGGRGLEDVAFSARGLGRELVPFVAMMQAPGKDSKRQIERAIPSQRAASTISKLEQTMVARYGADYGSDSQIFFARNPKLKLQVDLAGGKQAKDVRMVVGNASGATEIVFTPDRPGGVIKTQATIDLSRPASDIRLTAKSPAPLKAQVTVAEVSRQKQEVQFAKTAAIPLRKDSEASIRRSSRGEFTIAGAGLRGTFQIDKEAIGRDGRVKDLPSEAVRLGPQPEPPDIKRR